MTIQNRPSGLANPSLDGCRFCGALSEDGPSAFWDRPLFQSPNFVVIPSLGALRKGWVLIVPKAHHISAAALPDHLLDEMTSLKRALSEALTDAVGPVWAFEHGPAAEQRLAGCGVDHAHLHVVPLEIDLLEAVRPFLPAGLEFRSGFITDCREYARLGYDYLYAERPSGEGMFAVHRDLGSQVFRKAIANSDGDPAGYDWRDSPHLENMVATIASLASFHSHGGIERHQPELVEV